MAAIVVEDLSKRYRLRQERRRSLKELVLRQYGPSEEVEALKGVSFSVEEGAAFGVIGANGSGKSTLLKILAGTTRPSSGRVAVAGRVSALLEIGSGFHPDFTGRENAYLNGSILGLSRKEMERTMASIEDFADIGRFFDAPVKTYSSGMYTRLGFAVAVHVDPDVLLIDEILAVGDEYFQHKCMAKLAEFRARKKTILFVSHDLASVERICVSAMALERGRILALGDVQYVADAYRETVRAHEQGELARHSAGGRWGSRAVEITGVRILDASGADSRVLESGTPVDIVISYRARQAMDDAAFGVLLYADDGHAGYGSNTAVDGVSVPIGEGEGSISFHMPRLELLDGEWDLDVAVHKAEEGGEVLDYHLKGWRIRVFGAGREAGLIRIPHEWRT